MPEKTTMKTKVKKTTVKPKTRKTTTVKPKTKTASNRKVSVRKTANKPRKITGGPFFSNASAIASRMGSATFNAASKLGTSAYNSTVNHFSDPQKTARCDKARRTGKRDLISHFC